MAHKRLFSLLILVCYLAFSGVALAADVPAMQVDATAALLADPVTDQVMYEKNANQKLPQASLTKMMTALLVAESDYALTDTVIVSDTAMEGMENLSGSVVIVEGEEFTVKELLTLLMVASVNEAANVCAELVSGTIPAFVELMNARAEELGCTNTHFCNPHGLHEEEHYTTAYDLYLIARELMKHEDIMEIVGQDRVVMEETNKSKQRVFFSTNSLVSRYKEVGYFYKYATGLKTGTTTKAGLCLAASATKGDTTLISIVLGASRDADGKKRNFSESARLLQWGFDNFSVRELLSHKNPVCEVKVDLSWKRDYVVAVPAQDYSTMTPDDFTSDKLELITDVPEKINAPIEKGQVLGTVLVRYDGKDYKTVDLVAADDVDRSLILLVLHWLKIIFSSLVAKIIGIGFLILVVIYVTAAIRINRKGTRRYR